MADRFWVLDTGNTNDPAHWSTTSGGTGGASVPTSSDNAIFDANSFTTTGQTVTVNATFNCFDFVWTGATNSPTLAGSSQLNVYGNFTLINAMSYTHSGTLVVRGTSSYTFTSAGKTITSFIEQRGIGGTYTLQDALTYNTSSYIYIIDGTFITNNYNVSGGLFGVSGSTAKTVTLGSSIMTVAGNWDFSTTANTTLNRGTSKIVMTGNTKIFASGSFTYYDVETQGTPVTITGSGTFNKININASKTLRFTAGTTQTVSTDLIMGASSSLISATGGSNANLVFNGTSVTPIPTTVTKTDITVTTPNAPANKKYWVRNGGNTSTTTNWSTLSGFFGGFTVPSSVDSIYFDANSIGSASQTITVGATLTCLDFDSSTVTNSPTLAGSSNITCYGNIDLSGFVNPTHTGFVNGYGTSKTIKFPNSSASYFQITNSGTYTMQNACVTTGDFYLTSGTLTTANYNINCATFNNNNSNVRTLTLGSSIITCTGSYLATTSTNLTVTASTSKFVMTGNSTTFAGGDKTYYNLECQGTPVIVTGSNTFNDIILTPNKTIKFTSGSTTTLAGDLTSDGTAGNLIVIESTIAGSPATISKSSGTVEVNYYSIKDSTATGGATFRAINSTLISGNSGWITPIYINSSVNITFSSNSILYMKTYLPIAGNQDIAFNQNAVATLGIYVKATSSIEFNQTSKIVIGSYLSASSNIEFNSSASVILGISLKASVNIGFSSTAIPLKKLKGSLTDNRAYFFSMADKLYMMNGTDYIQIDGNVVKNVTDIAYIPTTFTGIPPAGGGTALESINYLSAGQINKFIGDGITTTYKLSEVSLDATTVTLTIAGASKTENTHFTVNRTAGTIDFSAGTSPFGAPPNGAGLENVFITFYKTYTGYADTIKKCVIQPHVFGGDDDIRVFVANKNYRYHSAYNDPTYFPVKEEYIVGSSLANITGFSQQNDTQLILKEHKQFEPSIYASRYQIDSNADITYPIQPINGMAGNDAKDSLQIIENNPTFLDQENGIYSVVTSNVRDQRLVQRISDKINRSLIAEPNKETAQSFIWKYRYGVALNGNVYVYDFRQNAWYGKWTNINASCFYTYDGELYFGSTTTGMIYKFENIYSDDGTTIEAYIDTKQFNFGKSEYKKLLSRVFYSLKPYPRSSVTVSYTTNMSSTPVELETSKRDLIDYRYFDYSRWTYASNSFPQESMRKVRAKKIIWIRFRYYNNGNNEGMGIINTSYMYIMQNLVKDA